MLFVDRLFLSQLSKAHLSAAMSGGLTAFTIGSLFAGIAGYANAMVAQYYGADRRDECSRTLVQALYFSLFCFPLLILTTRVVPSYFSLMGHSDPQLALESEYAGYLILGVIFLVLRNALSGFFLGIGRTRVVMVSNVLAMFVNIPLNYLLIFGNLGFPELGIAGAAVGTIGGSASAFFVLLIAYVSPRMNQEFKTRRRPRFEKAMFLRLLRFGSPAGIELFLNVLAFNVFVQLMHSYGADVAAATTITFNYDIVAFVPMLGLGVATTAVVGQYVGAQDVVGARKTTFLALRLAFVYAGAMMTTFILAAGPLVAVFAAGPAGGEEVRRLAETLLRLAGLYTLADATQLVFAGALRGAGDTSWVMRASVVLHWVFAGLVILLIRVLGVGPIVVWLLFITFVATMGLTMFFRFRAGKWTKMSVIDAN